MTAPLAAASPRQTVTYGSFSIAASTGCTLVSGYVCDEVVSEGVRRGNFYVKFRLRYPTTGTVVQDDAAFAALVVAAEAALQIPRKRLTVKIGASTAKDWIYEPGGGEAQNAVLIEPELELLEQNCRDYLYGFRVRCEFVGNLPGGTFNRRDSYREVGSSLRERRTCTITASWTSKEGETAYQRYLDTADSFCSSVLPSNITDQHGNSGTWVLASQAPRVNDENSVVTATRVYWELFSGRRDSDSKTITRLDERRTCVIRSTWAASGGNSALQNYQSSGAAFFTASLPSPTSGGEWVLSSEDPDYNDASDILTVTRTYAEVVHTRRESKSKTVSGIRERRTFIVSGVWFADGSGTASQNYATNGAAFFTSVLPSNVSGGSWIVMTEDPEFDDQNNVLTVTRVYWEVISGRRESETKVRTHIDGRREATVSILFVASGSNTALQNYNDGGDTFAASVLPANITGGEWVLVDSDPSYNDQNETLTVTRLYQEVVNGLHEQLVTVTAEANGLRRVEISGVYYKTASTTAKQNYTAGIAALVSTALTAEGVTRYEGKSIPKVTGYDTTGERYFFSHTYREIAYNQGPSADDPKVTLNTLDMKVVKPSDRQSVSSGITVTRLDTVEATYVASIDYSASTDPVGYWDSSIRTQVLVAIVSKLGSSVSTVEVVEEEAGVGLHNNTLTGRLKLVVTGGSVLSFWFKQRLTQVPGRDFAPMADGTPFSYMPYLAPGEKILVRQAEIEYVVGTTPPDPFGDADISGFGVVATGKTAQESIDDQEAGGSLGSNNWYIDRRAPHPYTYDDQPGERGPSSPFKTVVHTQIETWRYVASLLSS